MSIDVKKTTTTKMTVKKATVEDGTFYVDGEATNLTELLEEYFNSTIFDLVVTEKDEKEI